MSVVVAASCVADNDEPLATSDPAAAAPAAQVTPATIADVPDVAAARLLQRAFPAHVDQVLGRSHARGFVSADHGFVRGSNDAQVMHLDVELPLDAREAVRLIAPGGHEIRVRQIGVEGEGVLADRAVTYRRAGGTSFWTVTSGGVEEWLHLEAGAVTSDLDIAAEWEVEGATPVLMNGSVALMDGDGVARAWVTAPEAFGAEGRLVDLRLSVEGNRIELFADARGEEVLLDPMWVAVAPTAIGRIGPSVVRLGSGKVLVAAGLATGNIVPSVTELYDPLTNTWSSAGNLTTGRIGQREALLSTGRVLISGGNTAGGFTTTAERYDPVANSWSSAGAMTGARGYHALVALQSGNVLAAGGFDGTNMLATTQLYNPTTNTWSAGAAMTIARGFATAVRLTDGRVLVAGGLSGTGMSATINPNAEIYDPNTNTWTATPAMITPRYYAATALYTNGRVVVVGGYTGGGAATASTEFYDPATNTWNALAARTQAAGDLGLVLLGNDRFLAFGGDNNTNTVYASSDTFDPGAGLWSAAGNMNSPRTEAGYTTMPPGDAMVVNGASTITFDTATNTVDRFVVGNQAVGTTCSLNSQCASGFCVDGVCCTVAACAASDQCHDPGTCQPGTGVCSNPNKPDGATCNDGNGCTQTDTCQAGACSGANPVVCTASDQCHDVGTCNPATGVCSNPNKPNNTPCNDNSACTQTDTCQAGVCTGANAVVCTASDQCHNAGTCNPATGMCDDPAKPNGTVCNDNNACTQTDTCQAGICSGANPIVCSASDQCHNAGTCNPATGVCTDPIKTDGSVCNDNNACTQVDSCQAGVCTGASPVICMASDQCHDAGTCNTATGLCSNPPKADGTGCNDNNACTQMDSCQAGVCAGANPVVCTASDQCHDVGTCNPMTGMCSNPAKANGAACDDNDACTQTDSCQAGACTGADPITCPASDQCHDAGTCDSATGMCSNPAKADGAACNDDDMCTQTDTCIAGACTGANPVTCAASDQCHDAGTCDPTTGMCDNPAKADGQACDDGDGCTQSDTCTAGVCTGAMPVTCAAQDECHDAGKCDSTNGMCDNPAKPDGSPCSKGTCVAGVCTADGTGGAGGGTGGSAGSSAGGTGGTGGGNTTDDGGCSCRVVGSDDDRSNTAFAGLALAAMAMLRRRRSARN